MGSGQSTAALQGKTVVVIGGSFGGSTAARKLKGKCNLIVVDTREAMHISICSPRAVVEPEFTVKTLIPMKDLFGDSFKRGKVIGINPSENNITLEGGEKISFDYLIIATGSNNPFPGKMSNDTTTEETYELYEGAYKKVKAAKKITIVGGGACGVELAGEIATDFVDKEVTLIHSRDTLIEPAVSMSLRNTVKKYLEELNVKLVLGEKVLELDQIPRDLSGGPMDIKTDKGTTIPSDLVFVSIGLTVNKEAYVDSLGSRMDDRGSLRVNTYLQVEGHENIFAIGDCCNADQQKMALRAERHAERAAGNIILHADGKNMKPYSPPGVMFGLSVGRNRGAFQMMGMVFGSWLARPLKANDLFAGKIWSDHGLKCPDSRSPSTR